VLGPGGLARWTAEAEARVREGACGAYDECRTVVDLTSKRPPDPERDIILWRDRLHRPTFEASPDSPLALARDSARLTDAYGREDEAERERNESTVTEHEHDALLSAVRDVSFDISRRPPRNDKKTVSSTRLSSALRRLAAPSAFAATRCVAAHSPHALDRRIDGTARRARATRDETVDALAAAARRDALRNRRRTAPEAAKKLSFASAKRDDDSLSLSDVASYAASFKSGARADVREPISDDDSSLSSFADADSDDGEMSSRRREGATERFSPSRAKAKSSFLFKSRRVPKAPPFPAPPRETARAFLWAEKFVDHEVCVVEKLSETADMLDPASPRDALERFFGPAFFQTQRLDAATRPAWLAADSDSRYANETENARADLADVYSAAASAAVARARARYEATKKAVRRENREETARSRRAAAVASEAARGALRRRRELAGANVSRSAASSFRRRNEDAARKQKQKQTSSRARTANREPRPGPGPGSGVSKNSPKSAKRVERRETGFFSHDAPETAAVPLPANASRMLDLAWNPHACAPPNGVEALSADENEKDASVFGSRKPKHPSLLPYSPANAEACARAGDAKASRRLYDWCAYAGLPTRADATDGNRATCLKRAYLDALRLIEKLAPGVSAAAEEVTAAETKRRHAEARERKGRIPNFGDGKTTQKTARRASKVCAPRDDAKFARRNHPEWKM
jgi:hypothetical protein